ncbi:MAG TPA: hypothetical protein VGD80_09940 [Kofleriaceae bacterium]
MRWLIGLAVLAPMTAYAEEEAHPQELFLGEHAWLQSPAELQLSLLPAYAKDRWDMGAAAEYGLTSRVQLSLEGTWSDGPNMDALREVEIGARFGAWRSERWAVAVGASATAAMPTAAETEYSVEPQASLSFSQGAIGANLAASGTIASDVEPCVSVALFARFGSVIPIIEAGYMEGELMGRGGLAVRLGSAELGAAVGYGEELGASVHATLTWEIGFGDDDDGER